jgi:hypothetical protein
MSKVPNLLHLMYEVVKARNLRVLPEDIHRDFLEFSSYPGKSFLWLVHSHGSLVFPIGVGKNPLGLCTLLNPENGGTARVDVFLVDPTSNSFEKILCENTEKYAFQLPACGFSTVEEIVSVVRSVLDEGVSHSLWAEPFLSVPDLTHDDWPDWLSFFIRTKNSVMQIFLRKSIDVSLSKLPRSETEAA